MKDEFGYVKYQCLEKCKTYTHSTISFLCTAGTIAGIYFLVNYFHFF